VVPAALDGATAPMRRLLGEAWTAHGP
jgi:hypothetical protein